MDGIETLIGPVELRGSLAEPHNCTTYSRLGRPDRFADRIKEHLS